MDYRFSFKITEEGSTRHAIERDWVSLDESTIDEFGGCEMVDMAVARLLRIWKEKGRAEYERKVYGDGESEEECL